MKETNAYFRDDRKKSVERQMLKIQNREWSNQQFKVSGKSLRPISLMVPGEKEEKIDTDSGRCKNLLVES